MHSRAGGGAQLCWRKIHSGEKMQAQVCMPVRQVARLEFFSLVLQPCVVTTPLRVVEQG